VAQGDREWGLQSVHHTLSLPLLPLQGEDSAPSSPFLMWAPLSMGPQVLPEVCFSAGFPRGHSLLWASTCSGVGSSIGLRWISDPPWTSMGCRGTVCLTMVFVMAAGESAPVHGGPSPLPSSLTLVYAELFLSHRLTPRSVAVFAAFFSPSYVIPEVLPPSLMGWALASSGSILEPAGICFVRHREASHSFSQMPPL